MRQGKELLLKAVMELVQKELTGQGLRMFGAVLGHNREIQLLVPKSIKENPTADEIDSYWIEKLRVASSSRHCDAACYCAHFRVSSEGERAITPGVLVFIEQAGVSAEYRFYTYEKRENAAVVMHEPTIEAAPIRVFAQTST